MAERICFLGGEIVVNNSVFTGKKAGRIIKCQDIWHQAES